MVWRRNMPPVPRSLPNEATHRGVTQPPALGCLIAISLLRLANIAESVDRRRRKEALQPAFGRRIKARAGRPLSPASVASHSERSAGPPVLSSLQTLHHDPFELQLLPSRAKPAFAQGVAGPRSCVRNSIPDANSTRRPDPAGSPRSRAWREEPNWTGPRIGQRPRARFFSRPLLSRRG